MTKQVMENLESIVWTARQMMDITLFFWPPLFFLAVRVLKTYYCVTNNSIWIYLIFLYLLKTLNYSISDYREQKDQLSRALKKLHTVLVSNNSLSSLKKLSLTS
jgi:hypothetical protein